MNTTQNTKSIFFRKSHIVFILKLVALELFLAMIYLLVRIPKLFFLESIDSNSSQLLNIFGVVYFITLSAIELFLVLFITLDWANEEYEIRNESLIHKKGVFNLKQQTYTLRNLGSANIYQGFIGRLLNFGTIVITSPILKTDITLSDIQNPELILTQLEDNIDQSGVKNANIIHKKS